MDELVEVNRDDIEAFHALIRGMPLAAQMSMHDPQEGYRAFARHRLAAIAAARPAILKEAAETIIRVREKAIAARNFLAIDEPKHADRHLRDLITLCGEAVPEAVASHDAICREDFFHD